MTNPSIQAPMEAYAQIVSVTPYSQEELSQQSKKLAIIKPDIITEAISAELMNIDKFKKDITSLQGKINAKKAEIKKCEGVIKTLRKAKQQKESNERA